MKTLNIPFEDKEYEEIVKAKKKGVSWRDFMFEAAGITENGEMEDGNETEA